MSRIPANRAEFATSLLAAILLQLEVWVFEPGGPAVLRSLLALIAAGALAVMRTHPFAAYLTNGVAVYALIALGSPSDYYQWTNFIALVVMASRVSLARAVVGLFLGFVGIAFYFLRFPNEGGLATSGFVMALYLAGWMVGRAALGRVREEQLRADRDLSQARLAAQEARSELASERARLARELHDIVGHAVNLMVVQAGAGERVLDTDPERARASLKSVAETGRTALADLDRMLNLMAPDNSREALPNLSRLEELCDEFTASGLPVELRITGDRERVPASVGLAGYRLVQEALTNALKHSGASRVEVTVDISDQLTIRVCDDGRPGEIVVGRGLRGMVERAELHGGDVRFGPGRDGGFRVESTIPLGTRA